MTKNKLNINLTHITSFNDKNNTNNSNLNSLEDNYSDVKTHKNSIQKSNINNSNSERCNYWKLTPQKE